MRTLARGRSTNERNVPQSSIRMLSGKKLEFRMRIVFVLAGVVLALMIGRASAEESVASPLTPESYAEGANKKGVVLFAVRWDRRWKCGGFENAQLRLLAFDKLPISRTNEDENADFVLADAPLLMTKPRFDDYAFVVTPGEYALVGLQIKAAASASDVRIAKVGRERLIKDGRPEGGSFVVGAGEVVYIGHFYLDCFKEPTLWRFYPEDREAFNGFLAGVNKQHPELDASKVQFRLFKTTLFGRDFELK